MTELIRAALVDGSVRRMVPMGFGSAGTVRLIPQILLDKDEAFAVEYDLSEGAK